MKPTGKRSACHLVTCGVILSLGLACGCSAPKDNEQKKDRTPSSTVSQGQAETPDSQEMEKLKQENAEIKKAMAEALPFLDEVKRLRGENDELKKAVAEIPALKAKVDKLARENEALKRAAASALAANTMLGKTRSDPTQKKQSGDEGYRKYSEESEKKAAALLTKYDSADSVKAKLQFIESLSDSASKRDPSVLGVVRRAMEDPNTGVVRAAIDLLADYDTPEALPTIEQALMLADEQSRLAAVEPLAAINDPQVTPLLAQALNDPSPKVRAAAMDALQQQDSDPIRLSVMEKAIASPYGDVKRDVVPMLEERSDHVAVKLLIEGMKDQDPKFREQVSESLSFLVDQDFKTYEEAQGWWAQNENKFDADLIRTDDEAASPSLHKSKKTK